MAWSRRRDQTKAGSSPPAHVREELSADSSSLSTLLSTLLGTRSRYRRPRTCSSNQSESTPAELCLGSALELRELLVLQLPSSGPGQELEHPPPPHQESLSPQGHSSNHRDSLSNNSNSSNHLVLRIETLEEECKTLQQDLDRLSLLKGKLESEISGLKEHNQNLTDKLAEKDNDSFKKVAVSK